MDCPYFNLPPSNWWKHAVANRSVDTINPHLHTTLKLDKKTRVGSAGSCFAQHISKALVERGFNYFVTENPPAHVPTAIAERYGYGVFSARYANIYTPLQLLQLIERAFEGRIPADQVWCDSDGRIYDLLRPRITPRGFSSHTEWEADHAQHLSSVQRLLQEMDVFIFTLGLTEAWLSKVDGIVYPTCPGCGSAGVYDPDKYGYHNFTVKETSEHLDNAISKIKQINPKIEIILTVSPVPLTASMEARHILQATTYSKSVLRVAAEEAVKKHNNVHYFASYELITATCQTNTFFEEDRRTVTPFGIDYVMNCFFDHFASSAVQVSASKAIINTDRDVHVRPICDEEEFFRAVAAKKPT